jgi:hypothetical protein
MTTFSGGPRVFSFLKSKKSADIGKFMRRICDLTTPNLPVYDDTRAESRYNRSLPILLCPISRGVPTADEALVAVTSNLSEHSIGLVTHIPLNWQEGVAGLWLGPKVMDHPWFFQITVQANRPLGGGFWQVGVLLNDVLDRVERDDLGILNRAVLRLMPDQDA